MRLPFPWEIVQGADFIRVFDLWLSDTVREYLAGATFAASLSPRGIADAEVLSITTENDRASIIQPNRIRILVDKTDTLDLAPGDWWFASRVSYPSGIDRALLQGPVRVVAGVP
jgi:hypothetical protein